MSSNLIARVVLGLYTYFYEVIYFLYPDRLILEQFPWAANIALKFEGCVEDFGSKTLVLDREMGVMITNFSVR